MTNAPLPRSSNLILMMTAANRLGLYSAFLACRAIFFRSSFTPMLTVLEAMWSSNWGFYVKEGKATRPDNVLELRNNFWGCCRLVGCRRRRRWWGYWSIHWPFEKRWLWCLAHHLHYLSTWLMLTLALGENSYHVSHIITSSFAPLCKLLSPCSKLLLVDAALFSHRREGSMWGVPRGQLDNSESQP